MGYNTDLGGEFEIAPTPTEDQLDEIADAIDAVAKEGRKGDLSYDCPWEISDGNDGSTRGAIVPCGWERPYGYVDWLECIAQEILAPRGFTLNGDCWWVGEEVDDRGTIYVKDNVVEAIDDVIYNPGPSWDRKPAPTVA